MKCSKCGKQLEPGYIYCSNCGTPIQMVPDYNPLEEGLVGNIQKDTKKYNQPPQNTNHKKRKKKKIIGILLILLILLVSAGIGVYILFFSGSYTYQMDAAEKGMNQKKYGKAIIHYKNAIEIDSERAEAYMGLGLAYFAKGENKAGEKYLKKAIKKDTDYIEAYEALAKKYTEDGRESDLRELIRKSGSDKVKEGLDDYYCEDPQFSLKEGTYETVQTLILTCRANDVIYYTTNGNEVTTDSSIYTGHLDLKEGTTLVKAIAVNAKGVMSEEVSAEYKIEINRPEPPEIIPATGQYEAGTEIQISIPEGCKVYYTLDGSEPDKSSIPYTAPFPMTEGSMLVSAVAVNTYEQSSNITNRSYDVSAPIIGGE